MDYCRSLKFEEDPDYKFCVNLFDKCMKRHSLDPKTNDFIWKQNRLSKDKEALKNSMMDVIRKKPKDKINGSTKGMDSGVAGGLNETGGAYNAGSLVKDGMGM